MASQSTLTITRPDPSAVKVSNIYSDWTESATDGVTHFKATTTTFGVAGTDADLTQYSKEISLKGMNLNDAAFDIEDTGEAKVTVAWQWFNPFGTSYDGTGDQAGGEWTDFASPSATPAIKILNAGTSAEWEIIQKADKFRVKVVSVASGGSDVSSTINAADYATVRIFNDKTAELNLPMVEAYSGQTTAGSIGGIGVDPS